MKLSQAQQELGCVTCKATVQYQYMYMSEKCLLKGEIIIMVNPFEKNRVKCTDLLTRSCKLILYGSVGLTMSKISS